MPPRYWYFITNQRTGTSVDVVAESGEAACRNLGWPLDKCAILQVGEVRGSDQPRHPPDGKGAGTTPGEPPSRSASPESATRSRN